MPLFSLEETRDEVRALWKQCFHDSEAFLDLHFRLKYRPASTFTLRREGRVVAAVQVQPATLQFYGEALSAGYISGLSVDAAYRGKGLGAELMRRAHQWMYDQRMPLSFLVPADEALRGAYSRGALGQYRTVSMLQEVALDALPCGADDPAAESGGDEGAVRVTDYTGEAAALYRLYTALRGEEALLRIGRGDFYAAFEDSFLGYSYALTAHAGRRQVGFALAWGDAPGAIKVNALMAESERTRRALLAELSARARRDGNKVIMRQPLSLEAGAQHAGARPYLIARAVHTEQLLAQLQPFVEMLREMKHHLFISHDAHLPVNNGAYAGDASAQGSPEASTPLQMTPGDVARAALGGAEIYAPLLLDE